MQAQHYKILLVDDDTFISDLYATKFTAIGHELTSAYSVAQALSILQDGAQFDAIATDLIMPEQDGFDLLRELKVRSLCNDAVLIALTNQDSVEIESKLNNLGVDQHIIKAHTLPNEVVRMVLAAIETNK